MVATIEKGTYQIPISDEPHTSTGKHFVQTCGIPVTHTEEEINPFTIQYLRFAIIPGKHSPLDILAGGEDLKIAGARIRAQMISRLKLGLAAIQKPDHSPKINVEIERLSEYFQLI